ncbi:hypothetical protein HWD35_04085 [Tsukamurella tyrosinosolvens]|uniref:hypothetical protein n=2 Tax=Tsukamurella tyrosinosolvens TaxID=57704 RepID=UPI00079A867C|nr:hypothetical protein [Tsukamurella tyrosinosolvens]KXP05550.1 hypothetical protein AXK59_08375 [Tsukamurella tyrosinosolvens]MCA4993885.1 hypothetical protein [Tsukamurella tyrosinosolvens]MEC4612731.1 hypothetical protein [Tsukamurella tyrosinosolvens]QRY82829.1 hypothetical protein JVY00_12995 [Tsukamurella tyrosinosolvens]WEL94676.1 hypothetical protein P1N98_07295 [Tsukamurella tyrosinosolvens]
MHRSTSLPDLAEAVAAVPADRRHAAGLALVSGALDRAADPALDAAGEVLLDERRAPGSRRGEADRLAAAVDRLDREAHARRRDGDHTGYILGFQSARVMAALHFLVRDGGGGLADVAYEAVMVCGATEPVIAELVGARR